MSYRASIIKSIQRGTITMSGTSTQAATITAVDLPNSVVNFLGFDFQTDAGVSGAQTRTHLVLTNSTTVTATRTTGAGSTVRVNYEVIEYFPGVLKSVQRGVINVTTASNTATITAVVVGKSTCVWLGSVTNDGNAGEYTGRTATKVELTNSTTVTASRGVATNSCDVSYEVREFF